MSASALAITCPLTCSCLILPVAGARAAGPIGTTDGMGDTQALASNAKPEGRAMNRRVEFAKL